MAAVPGPLALESQPGCRHRVKACLLPRPPASRAVGEQDGGVRLGDMGGSPTLTRTWNEAYSDGVPGSHDDVASQVKARPQRTRHKLVSGGRTQLRTTETAGWRLGLSWH